MKPNDIYSKMLQALYSGKNALVETTFSAHAGDLATGLSRQLTLQETLHSENGHIRPSLQEKGKQFLFLEPLTPSERLIILGGGHIALPLCEFAAKTGFSVTVVDDRPVFCNPGRFPWAKETICDSFEHAISALHISAYDSVVIITRGHRHDADCLRTLLPGIYPSYMGLIGSRRRVSGLFQMLREEGLDGSLLERICTPIGLPIGAVTPEEIAVSILSELIAYKCLPDKRRLPVNESDLDLQVIQHLAEDTAPKAIVTVLRTRGSTPRKEGAKMVVDAIGRITGSIGGGCSEGAIIRDAISIIETGRYEMKLIDMTNDVAESEGMVCGGTMEVLIEDGTV